MSEVEKPSNVVDLASWKEENSPHISGECQCLECKHRWVAVSPVGVTEFECPACGLFKGVSSHVVVPANREILCCIACGNHYYLITRTGYMCSRCGVERGFEEIDG